MFSKGEKYLFWTLFHLEEIGENGENVCFPLLQY